MEINYCSNCGAKLEIRFINEVERKACPSCSFVHWGNYSVSVGALVRKEGTNYYLFVVNIIQGKGNGQILGAILSKQNLLNKVLSARY